MLRGFVFFLLLCMVFTAAWEDVGVVERVTYVRMLGYGAIALAVCAVAATMRMRRPPAPLVMLAVYVGWCVLSTAWSPAPETTLLRCRTYVSLWLFAWMLWEFAPRLDHQRWVMNAFIAGAAYSTTFLLLSFLRGEVEIGMSYTRFSGGLLNPNGMAHLGDFAILLAYYQAIRTGSRHRRLRIAYWVFIVIMAFAVLLTGSRSGFTAMVASGLLCGWASVRQSRKTFFLLMAAGLCTLTLAIWFVPNALRTRVVQGTAAGTFQARVEIWEQGFARWIRTPVLGVGAGAFQTAATGTEFELGSVAHNTFVSVLTETGLIGFGLYMASLVMLVRHALSMPRTEKYLWLAVLLVWGLASFGGSEECSKTTWLVFGLLVAHGAALRTAGRAQRPAASVATMPAGWRAARRPNR